MTRARYAWALSSLVVMLCALGIGTVQPQLARLQQQGHRDDVLILPPPAHLRALTFGYPTAGADLLWAKLLVEHGLHWEEKRAFPDLPNYIDGILALDPDHPLIYDFVDTLLLFVPNGATEADARLARTYLERGTQRHPYDPHVWLRYGEFVAFLGPSFIKDQSVADQWRKDGALALGHAVELGADADHALAATTILSKAGERKATIAYLQRAYALTDNPETRRQLRLKLQKLEASNASLATEAAVETVEREWQLRFPFFSRGGTLLLGPHRDPAACAGPRSYGLKECPRDWSSAVGEAP
jgi:hypothetical protein